MEEVNGIYEEEKNNGIRTKVKLHGERMNKKRKRR